MNIPRLEKLQTALRLQHEIAPETYDQDSDARNEQNAEKTN